MTAGRRTPAIAPYSARRMQKRARPPGPLRNIDSREICARLSPRTDGWRPSSRSRARRVERPGSRDRRSEEHTSELQSLMRISYAVFCLKKKKKIVITSANHNTSVHFKLCYSTRYYKKHLSILNVHNLQKDKYIDNN